MQHKKKSDALKALVAWMKANKISNGDLAESIGIARENLWRWLNGSIQPMLKHAIILEELTDGQISCRSWYTYSGKLKTATNQKRNPKDKKKG